MVPCNDIPRGLNVPSETQRGNTMPLNDELEGRMSYSLARSPLRLPGSADINGGFSIAMFDDQRVTLTAAAIPSLASKS